MTTERRPISYFLIGLGLLTPVIAVLFGPPAAALGLVTVAIGAVILSLEPVSALSLVLVALAVGAFALSPLTAAGAAVIIGYALLFSLVVLARRSRKQGREIGRYDR